MAKVRSGFPDERKLISSALSLYFSSQSSRPRLCFISCLCLGHCQTESFKPPCFILNWGGRKIYKTSTSFLLAGLYHQNRYDSCPGVQFSFHRPWAFPLTQSLIMANRTTAHTAYPIVKSIISNLNQRQYLDALVAGLNLRVEREVGEPIIPRGPCTEFLQRYDHRGMVAGLVTCKNQEWTPGVKKIRLCTQFDPRPGSHRALCKSVCSICRDNITIDHNPVVNTFLRMKGQTRSAKDNVYYRVHNPRAIHCQECSEKNRAEIRDGKNKCTCLATLNSTWRCNWCHNEGFQRLKAEVNAASKRLYNTHRHRVGKKGNRKHKYELVVKAKPQRAWRACPTPGCGKQLWLNNARKVYRNDEVPYHPRSTMMCLGCNEIGVPRLSVTTAEAAAAAAGH